MCSGSAMHDQNRGYGGGGNPQNLNIPKSTEVARRRGRRAKGGDSMKTGWLQGPITLVAEYNVTTPSGQMLALRLAD